MTGASDPAALVNDALASWGIEHAIIKIDPDFADTAQFCEKYGYPPERSANTILVASKKGPQQYCACVVLASTQLDVNKRVRKLMGVRRVSFASAEQTKDVTGMMIGGVTPFGLPGHVPIYVDEGIDGLDYVILGSGSRSSKVKMPGAEFSKIPGAQFISELAVQRKKD
jgi:prolyl-tRNA editing enzyme YbaK/EbsC (Cys-tRNA(Pro) deacylase)